MDAYKIKIALLDKRGKETGRSFDIPIYSFKVGEYVIDGLLEHLLYEDLKKSDKDE